MVFRINASVFKDVLIRARKPIAGGLTAGIIAASAISLPILKQEEGRALVAYPDYGGVWTLCDGETENVHEGDRATNDQCDALTLRRTQEFTAKVFYSLSPPTQAFMETHHGTLGANGRFAYNIGIGGYRTSLVKIFNDRGDYVHACRAMLNWYKSNGHDCRLDKGKRNGCYGMWVRRQRDAQDCETGLDL